MESLEEVVESLTRPKFEHVSQKIREKWVSTAVELPGLLEQMRRAVFPSSNRDTGSASSKSTRSPADLQAMYAFALMGSQIADWCHTYGIRATRDATADLIAWFDRARGLPDLNEGWFLRKLQSWRTQITDHLEPPESFVPEYPCPVCDTREWGDQINGGGLWPIEVRYRRDDTDASVTDEVARCRPCGTVWYGHESIVELADEVKEKAHG